jgi:hypothetical protein
MIYEGIDVKKNATKSGKIFGFPRAAVLAVAGLVVLGIGYASYVYVSGQQKTATVPAETIEKVHACVGDGTANITRRARADATYAADREAIKRDVAKVNEDCEKQNGVEEMPPRTASQIHHSTHDADN